MGTLTTLVKRRRLLALMARQDLKIRYDKFRFGLLWSVLEPLLMAAMMYVVFTYVIDRGGGLDPFIVYLMTGLLPFQWLSSSIGQGPATFRKYGTLLTFSKIPVVTWPLRSVIVGFAEMIASLPVLIILMVALGTPLTSGIVLVPVGFVAQVLLCLGLAMVFASIGATLPDAQKLTGLLVRAFFWGSPILWFGKDFGELQKYLYLNPFYGILDMYRAAIWPEEVLSTPQNYLLSGSVILVIFVGGLVAINARTREIRQLG